MKNNVAKGENAGKPAFSPFPTMLSKIPMLNLITCATFNMQSANDFNLEKANNCCLVKSSSPIQCIKPFPKQQILDSSKLKEIADNDLKLTNIVGNGDIAHYEQFILFPKSFQQTLKNKGLFGKELINKTR